MVGFFETTRNDYKQNKSKATGDAWEPDSCVQNDFEIFLAHQEPKLLLLKISYVQSPNAIRQDEDTSSHPRKVWSRYGTC